MFSGEIENFKGQNVIFTRTQASGEISRAFENVFYKYGAKIHYATVEEHDEAAAYVQSLIHIVIVCLAQVMREGFDSPEKVKIFNTPNSRALLTTIRKVLSQQSNLLCDIQMLNDKASAFRQRFLESIFNTISNLDNNQIEEFINDIKKSREFFEIS